MTVVYLANRNSHLVKKKVFYAGIIFTEKKKKGGQVKLRVIQVDQHIFFNLKEIKRDLIFKELLYSKKP
jgi:hypothetical protein